MEKQYLSFVLILEALNNYALGKDDNKHVLTGKIGPHYKTFKANNIGQLSQPVGDWICKLPQEIKDKYLI